MDFIKLTKKLKEEIDSYFEVNAQKIIGQSLDTSKKEDKSLVTEIDLHLSNLIKKHIPSDICFFSEEDHDELSFPAIIVDPIDGTRELSKGINECAVSIAFMNSSKIDDPKNEAWIYNPFNYFEVSTSQKQKPSNKYLDNNLLMVSRTEWKKDIYKDKVCADLIIAPKGSIAYKLGLLAAGICDAVYTHKPKNIWDIAAGTILCYRNNIFMRAPDKVLELNETRVDGKIAWASNDLWLKNIQDFYKEMQR